MNQLELNRLGRLVNCQFCQSSFTATSPDSTSAALDDPLHYWINFTANDLTDSPEWDGADQINRAPR